MIRYHGGPITPSGAALSAWRGSHAMISFAHPDQLPTVAELCQSFALDNGAFSFWKGATAPDWDAYVDWCWKWSYHPGFDFALIPDVIDGNEEQNDELILWWKAFARSGIGVPVWHMHESLIRLTSLVDEWPRVAIGSSGRFATIGTEDWWIRIAEAMKSACDGNGRPKTKLHGLRQMDPAVFCRVPYSSVDSTVIARNINLDQRWKGTYAPSSESVRALVIRDRVECCESASQWSGEIDIAGPLFREAV